MTFRHNQRKTAPRARTGGGTGKIALGGGAGTIILVLIVWALGGSPQEILGLLNGLNSQDSSMSAPAGPAQSLDHCKTGADANNYVDCRIEFTALSLDAVWARELPRQIGINYNKPGLVIFTGRTRSACGVAGTATGPFYCPGDRTAYFDPEFFHQLETLGARNAPFAQEYIVAHEFGHHIQQLQGTLGLSNYNDPGPESNAVRIELQADCYAGIWAHFADKGPDAFLEPVTREQVLDALAAARSVGDDHIQQHRGGEVRPDLFTHGRSDQREKAFYAGYRSGEMSQCSLDAILNTTR
ncbi:MULTISPECIES: neutral zinc metallopeptidase [unclassified Corynebacterium]|uniref:KPN_02809 family neutral zinc metallopeptidase n=1 Tax=unclassified Corynebacterium TaxID=2624378 RepID=UPI002167CCE9|nr:MULTISPECIES: neutral zinc metallopeptidase [unclassified Corynebacterium]MCS4489245.1 neutral zinc metallopeptidase [Corynebacterium sp. ES2775-CONJ]MCS4491058.1 neutral zinc metallopeptidase [Corynebacterium sp. ES2715-CONJ3]MCS4531061.1 neutral zinc metallopeptidase [Corynebacterium sp. ES2730-CONJ]